MKTCLLSVSSSYMKFEKYWHCVSATLKLHKDTLINILSWLKTIKDNNKISKYLCLYTQWSTCFSPLAALCCIVLTFYTVGNKGRQSIQDPSSVLALTFWIIHGIIIMVGVSTIHNVFNWVQSTSRASFGALGILNYVIVQT